MTLSIILLIIGYIMFLISPILYTRYRNYSSRLDRKLNYVLTETTIQTKLAAEINLFYLKKTHRVQQNIAEISKYVGIILGLLMPVFSVSVPDESIFLEILFMFMLSLGNFTIGGIIYMVSDLVSYDRKPKIELNTEDILDFYFKKEYPSLHAVLLPIYMNIQFTSTKYNYHSVDFENRYISRNHGRYNSKNYWSRFGHCLSTFTTIFENARLDENSKAIFNAYVSKTENIEILAKIIVFLADKTLLEQLNNEKDNESAILFNDRFEKMILDLNKKINESKESTKKMETLQSKLDETKARERLDLLVKQSFNVIK